MTANTPEITLWLPEPDTVLHQALGKLTEEANELGAIAARCIIQGFCESDPKSGKHNYVQLREEMADVQAVLDWLRDLRPDLLSAGMSPRYRRKLEGFRTWQEMIEARNAGDGIHG